MFLFTISLGPHGSFVDSDEVKAGANFFGPPLAFKLGVAEAND